MPVISCVFAPSLDTPAHIELAERLGVPASDDVAAMRVGTSTEAYAKTRADEANFLAGELPFVITTERTTFPRA